MTAAGPGGVLAQGQPDVASAARWSVEALAAFVSANAHWLDVAAAVGVLVLAAPVWRMNHLRKALRRASERKTSDAIRGEDVLLALAEAAAEARKNELSLWRLHDEICLWIGYGLLLGASLLRIVASWPR